VFSSNLHDDVSKRPKLEVVFDSRMIYIYLKNGLMFILYFYVMYSILIVKRRIESALMFPFMYWVVLSEAYKKRKF
jgi:hypothetical protein